jgi:hypothetical protein
VGAGFLQDRLLWHYGFYATRSVNNIVKKCHVDANTPLHEFAKQMMKLLHRRKMTEGAATYAGTVYISSQPIIHYIPTCNAVCMIIFCLL